MSTRLEKIGEDRDEGWVACKRRVTHGKCLAGEGMGMQGLVPGRGMAGRDIPVSDSVYPCLCLPAVSFSPIPGEMSEASRRT